MEIDSYELKSRLTVDNTIEILEYYGAEIKSENEEYIVFSAICHNSSKGKLYLYKETNSLYCWSQCGGIDVIHIVQQEEDLDFQSAIDYIANWFQIGRLKSFGRPTRIEHKPREIKQKEIDVNEKLPMYQDSILNTFVSAIPLEWIKEGISPSIMEQFGIKIDINTTSIIIPHRDVDGRLIGIRNRNLLEDRIEKYGKYTPYTCPLSGIMYNHPLSKNLYGLYENKDNIINKKKAIIFESEKSVLQMNSYYPNDSIAVSVGGSVVHQFQIELLRKIGVEEVIICFDYEIRDKLLQKFEKSYKRCNLYFKTYILDNELEGKLLEESDSPTDRGKDIFEELLLNKIEYKMEV